MGLLLHTKICKHYFSHGLGALVNKAVHLCADHYNIYNNSSITIIDQQINDLFEHRTEGVDFTSSDPMPYYQKEIIFGSPYGVGYWPFPPNMLELVLKNRVFYDCFKIKKELEESFQRKMIDLVGRNTIGIHLRGTDKATEVPRVTSTDVMQVVGPLFHDRKIDSIFLATDDMMFQTEMKAMYGDNVRFDESNTVSSNGHPIHHDHTKRKRLNQEALSDAWLLSQCKYFAYCNSNLSYLALTMGINNFTETINLQP